MMIFLIIPLFEKEKMTSSAYPVETFAGRELVCAIDLGERTMGKSGLETGFNYEIFKKFAEDNDCKVEFVNSRKSESYLDSLKEGKVDIVVTFADSTLDCDSFCLSRSFDEQLVWAMNKEMTSDVKLINNWILHYTVSGDYERLQKRFFSAYNPHKRAENGIKTNRISPYDDLIKKYARNLGWDWRMLAAVIYQESKFSMDSRSFRGAQGLMQVMPLTGRYYGIEDLKDPEQNIIAGTSHLRRLQNMFKKYDIEPEELIKFTLAAYNAGEGRIIDCRNLAEAQQVDSRKWDDVVSIIPLMREDSILENEAVKLGKFQGYETIDYVQSVLSHYEAYCAICPSI